MKNLYVETPYNQNKRNQGKWFAEYNKVNILDIILQIN